MGRGVVCLLVAPGGSTTLSNWAEGACCGQFGREREWIFVAPACARILSSLLELTLPPFLVHWLYSWWRSRETQNHQHTYAEGQRKCFYVPLASLWLPLANIVYNIAITGGGGVGLGCKYNIFACEKQHQGWARPMFLPMLPSCTDVVCWEKFPAEPEKKEPNHLSHRLLNCLFGNVCWVALVGFLLSVAKMERDDLATCAC